MKMGVLGSCKEKAFKKWCRLPKFHCSTYVHCSASGRGSERPSCSVVQCSAVGGALSDLHACSAVQWVGLGANRS